MGWRKDVIGLLQAACEPRASTSIFVQASESLATFAPTGSHHNLISVGAWPPSWSRVENLSGLFLYQRPWPASNATVLFRFRGFEGARQIKEKPQKP